MRVLLYRKQKYTSSVGLLPNTNLFMPPVATEKCLGRAALGRVPPLLFQFLRCLIFAHFMVGEDAFPRRARGSFHNPEKIYNMFVSMLCEVSAL